MGNSKAGSPLDRAPLQALNLGRAPGQFGVARHSKYLAGKRNMSDFLVQGIDGGIAINLAQSPHDFSSGEGLKKFSKLTYRLAHDRIS